MAGRLAAERDDGLVVRELEAAAAGAPPTVRRRRPVPDTPVGPAPTAGRPRAAGGPGDRTITASDGARLTALVAEGPGPTVVLVHGIGLTSRSGPARSAGWPAATG